MLHCTAQILFCHVSASTGQIVVGLQAADCLSEVGGEIYGDQRLWRGFRTCPLVRFVAGERGYLSNTHNGPRMYINLEDYLSYATGKASTQCLTDCSCIGRSG